MSLRSLCHGFRQLNITRQSCLASHPFVTNGPFARRLLSAVIIHCCQHNNNNNGFEIHVQKMHTTGVAHKSLFIPYGKTGKQKYTIRPLKQVRYSGRDLDTGRIVHKKLGGGHKQNFRMIDLKREPPEDGSVYEEKVLDIQYDPNRTTRIALVAGGNKKRYILATMNMKIDDIIKTSGQISRLSVSANEGDAYRLAALPIGTLVNSIPMVPGGVGKFARAAGTSGQVIRKTSGMVMIQLPSKVQISVSDQCMVTIGRLSNEENNQKIIGKAGRNRWLGKRPSSGLWQRKDGRHGRKIKPLPPIKVYMDKKQEGKHIQV